MLLKSCSIKNYRSIFNLKLLEFSSNLTTLLGKNNQGKSNILKAINLVFDAIICVANIEKEKHIPYWNNENKYNWNSDYPIQRQNKQFDQNTTIILEIELNDSEKKEFIERLKIKASSLLNIKLILKKEKQLTPNLEISFRGISNIYKSDDDLLFDSIAGQICLLIREKMDFQYIPAIRTDELANEIVNSIISLELSQLAPQKRKSLEDALKKISELQEPILKKLENNLSTTLKDFVPEIKKVTLNATANKYRRMNLYSDDNFYIKINDGSDTKLSQKGDGIKSLITLGMMRQKGAKSIGKGLILAIEEPESHLHPDAIRQISRVIQDISENNQIIVTSHSPLFVNRNNISDNIIVDKNTASRANNMLEIRNTLGVIASDNLINSEFFIVVEGDTDKFVLLKYIKRKSKYLTNLIREKRLCFEILNGVNNLGASLNKLSNMSSKYFCILDNDQITREKVNFVKEKSFVSPSLKEVSYYTVLNRNESELEDLINIDYYKHFMQEKFNIDIASEKKFTIGRNKWSKRIEKVLKEKGKIYDKHDLESILQDIKIFIANNIDIENDENAIYETRTSINNIIIQLENYFKNNKEGSN